MKYIKPALLEFQESRNNMNCIGGSGNTVTVIIRACSAGGAGKDILGPVCIDGSSGDSFGQTVCASGSGDSGEIVIVNGDGADCLNGPNFT